MTLNSTVDKMPEVDIGIGETVYQIRNVAYLKRGKVYTICCFNMKG